MNRYMLGRMLNAARLDAVHAVLAVRLRFRTCDALKFVYAEYF